MAEAERRRQRAGAWTLESVVRSPWSVARKDGVQTRTRTISLWLPTTDYGLPTLERRLTLPFPSSHASLLPMPLFRVFRTPPQWLRAMLLVMALGFALNSVAHASHSHDVTSAAAQHLSCGYCVHLGALADGPKHAHGVAPLSSSERLEAQAHSAPRSRAPELAAQPRAPPSL
jgi:hypothetical protein